MDLIVKTNGAALSDDEQDNFIRWLNIQLQRAGATRRIVSVEDGLRVPTSDRIARIQSSLFSIRENLRDTLDDAKDARFIRLAAELGALASEFLPEESTKELFRGGDTGDWHTGPNYD